MFNKSVLITSKECAECRGHCCRSYMMRFSKKLPEYDLSIAKRLGMLDCEGIWVEDDGEYLIVHFDYPCKNLDLDGKCRIYLNPDRPYLCKIFPRHDDYTCLYKK